MSRKRTEMGKITEILRLRGECGWSYQRIGARLNISKTAAHRLAERAEEAGIGWPLPDGVDEDGLARVVYGDPQSGCGSQIDFEWVSRQMERKGVTLKLLWTELCDQGYPYGYAWFCRCCQQWESRTRRTMRMSWRLGEAVFVDYAGATVGVCGRKAQIFVAALGVSHYNCSNFGLRPLEAVDRHDLLELMDRRYGRSSIAIVSQLPVAQWHAAIGDATLADAILDRVVHNAHRIELKGESMRKRNAMHTADAEPNPASPPAHDQT